MLTNRFINYKDYTIDYDDFGFWTVQYCCDDVVFNTVEDAKIFIDEITEEESEAI